jgi:hypothetical protein
MNREAGLVRGSTIANVMRTWAAVLALSGCRVVREEPSGPDAAAEPVAPVIAAPALELRGPSLFVEDGGTSAPFFAIAPPVEQRPDAQAAVAEPAAPSAPSPPAAEPLDPGPDDAGVRAIAPPPSPSVPTQAAVVVLAKGVAAPLRLQIVHEVCRALGADKPVWRALDQGLRRLTCELRATGRAPREALVMGSDGRLGATGALPFDLDPARVVALVRDRGLGTVVADGARALTGAAASWTCPWPEAPAGAERPTDGGYAALLVRDTGGVIAAGLVTAPPAGRPEGWLSAAVVPGDYLFVQGATAAVAFGADARLRGRARARHLQEHAFRSGAPLSHDDPLLLDLEQLVWLDRARVGTPDPAITQLAWDKASVPEPCRPPPAPETAP